MSQILHYLIRLKKYDISVLRQKSSSIHSPKIFEIICNKDLYEEVTNQISQLKNIIAVR